MIIDFHTHSFPDKIAANAIEKLSSSAHIKAFADGTANGILKNMSDGGIDLSVMLPVAVKPSNVESMNSYSANFNDIYEMVLDAVNEQYEEKITKLKAEGFKIVE